MKASEIASAVEPTKRNKDADAVISVKAHNSVAAETNINKANEAAIEEVKSEQNAAEALKTETVHTDRNQQDSVAQKSEHDQTVDGEKADKPPQIETNKSQRSARTNKTTSKVISSEKKLQVQEAEAPVLQIEDSADNKDLKEMKDMEAAASSFKPKDS